MWNLDTLTEKLRDRLSETSAVFWEDLEGYLNEANRLIGAITKGVPQVVTADIDVDSFTFTLPEKMIGTYGDGFYTSLNEALVEVSHEEVKRKFPRYRTIQGNPRWVTIDMQAKVGYVFPVGGINTALYDESIQLLVQEGEGVLSSYEGYSITGRVAVLPDDMDSGDDFPFNNAPAMEQYQGALINYAACLALLKERYDGDAERFFQFFTQELSMLGVNPESIPSMEVPNAMVG